MKLKEGYVVKDIVGNVVVIPIGQVLMDGGKNIRLNSEGAFFIRHILAGKNDEEITNLYSELFSEDLDRAREELEGFIEYAVSCGFLEMETK